MAAAYPFRMYRYRGLIDGQMVGTFREISAPEAASDPIEYREDHPSVSGAGRIGGQPSGLIRYGNVTLKWGATSSSEFYNWVKETEGDRVVRKNLTISLADDSGAELATWTILSARPIKYVAPCSNGINKENVIELIELAHEGITRDS